MIDKELYEAITGYRDDTEEIGSHGRIKIGYKEHNLNIHELVNMAKKWAHDNGFRIESGMRDGVWVADSFDGKSFRLRLTADHETAAVLEICMSIKAAIAHRARGL